ncbi:MAG: phosphoribosyltransferase family protein [Flexilinea sp.]
MDANHHDIELAGVKRSLPLFEVAPGLRIAVLNTLGDTELVEACAEEIAKKLKGIDFDVLVTAESKSIPFTHALSVRTGKPYVVCRKNYKSYMGKALESTSNSITTQLEQHLILDEKDIVLIKGKKVVIVDDVISTGSTLHALTTLIHMAGGDPDYKIATICTEGGEDDWPNVICLGHLPLFKD